MINNKEGGVREESGSWRTAKEIAANAILLAVVVTGVTRAGYEQGVKTDDVPEHREYETEFKRMVKETGASIAEAFRNLVGITPDEAIDSGLANVEVTIPATRGVQETATAVPTPTETPTATAEDNQSTGGVDTNPYDNEEFQKKLLEYQQQWCTPEGGWHYSGDLEEPDYLLPSRVHSPQNQLEDFSEVTPGVWEAHFEDPLFGNAVMRMTTQPDGSIVQEIIYDSVEFCPAD